MNIKKVVCPYCGHKYVSKPAIYTHIESTHIEQIPEGIPVDQAFYDMTHIGIKKNGCVICHNVTPWNPRTHKYQRLCGRDACSKKVRQIFHERMMKKYHTDNLAKDPEHQRKMLKGRRISGEYKWADGNKTDYVGSYELEFLRFCDAVMDMKSTDILAPSPNTYTYEYNGEKHFYIPDFYIPDLNLEIEIKDGGDNPNMHHKIQAIDKVKEMAKDNVMLRQTKCNYIKIVNKQHGKFAALYKKLSSEDLTNDEALDKIKILK
jgi:hypothetical protein